MGTIDRLWCRRVGALSLAWVMAIAGTPACGAGQSGAAAAVALKPMSIVKIRDLDFGVMIAGTTAGTVTIDPTTDQRTTTGGTTAAGGAPQAAQFYTYGSANQVLQVNRGPLPTLARVGGGATMAVNQLTLNGPTMRVLNSSGVLDLRVGGLLAVGANQLSGTYNGTFDIIVTYF